MPGSHWDAQRNVPPEKAKAKVAKRIARAREKKVRRQVARMAGMINARHAAALLEAANASGD